MKKLALVLAGTAIASTGFSQVSIDPEVGLNISNVRTKVGDADATTTDSKVGFSVGVGAQFDIKNGLYVKPAIQYHMLGGKTELLGVESSTTLHQLRIPVNLGYEYTFSPKAGGLFVEAGPYIGYSVAGTNKVGDLETDVNFGTETTETNPLDWGFNFGLGYTSPWGVYIKGGYGLGLGNMSNVDDVKVTNNQWNAALGYKVKL